MKEAVREGRYVWMAPCGYDNITVALKATIGPNQTMAPLMLQAFEDIAAEHLTTEEVWQKATANGLRKKNGKPVSRGYFYDLLKNEIYMGWINKFGERHKGVFTAIVPESLFHSVHKILKKRGKKCASYVTDNPEFPLRRFVSSTTGVKLTGAKSTGRKGVKYPLYRFRDGGTNYRKDDLHILFADFMDSYAISDKRLTKLKQFVQEKFAKATRNEREHLERANGRLTAIHELESNLVESMGVLSQETFKRQMERLEKEEADLKSLLSHSVHQLPNVSGALKLAWNYLHTPSLVWASAGVQTKLKLQRFQFPSGVMFDGQKFETTEVSCIFALKSEKSTELSTVVDSIVLDWNGIVQEIRAFADIFTTFRDMTSFQSVGV